jgi:hypothetical protein
MSAPARAGVVWELVSADESGLRLRVTIDEAILSPRGEGLSSIRLAGAHLTGEPGMPALPADARWFALPPGANATLRVLSSSVEELGVARLVPVPMSGIAPDAVEGPRLIERLEFAEAYDSFRRGENEVAVLSAAVHQRRQRMAAIGIQPILYDAASGRVRVVRELELSVRWTPPRVGADPAARSDPTILSTVLNPEQAREWAAWSPRQERLRQAYRETSIAPRVAPAVGIQPLDPLALVADGIRLRVDRTGIVRVTVADLMSGGGLPDDVPRSWLRLAQMRSSEPGSAQYPAPLVVDTPVHFFGRPDESGLLSSTDEIYFHALRVEDDADTLESGGLRALPALPWGESNPVDQVPPRYSGDHFNRDNVYWVYLMPPPVGGWARMEAVTVPPSGGSPASSYLRREHFEGDQGYREEPLDTWVERYAWNRLEDADVVRALRLVSPVVGADLNVKWAAGAHISGSTIPVDFSLRQGGAEVALSSIQLQSDGIMADWSRILTNAPFVSGALEFRMRRLFNGQDVAVNSFLDHVVLEYRAAFIASSDALRFGTGVSGGIVDVEVDGYSRSDLLCFDVSDPHAPRWMDLAAANVVDRSAGGPANFALSMQVSQAAGEEILFSASPRVHFFRIGRASIEVDETADLFAIVNDLQVLAIGPEQFRAQTDRWMAWREQSYASSGWNFGYVDVQQIYDEFSGGLQSPWAIRQFVEWAWLNWDAVALVLVGDGNEDATNASGRAGPNFVPPSLHLQSFIRGSRELLASDKWYGLFGYVPFGNNQYPRGLEVTSDLVVGRFPIGSEDELSTLVDKIIAYEQSAPGEEWKRRTLWVADDAFSTDYIGAGTGCYRFQELEPHFLASQQASALVTESSLDGTVSAAVLNADDFTRDCRLGVACENLTNIRQCFSNNHSADFLDRWSQGWLWLSYQGHANFNVLGHENLVLGRMLPLLHNEGRPFVFFGMGCHVSDFLRAEEGVDGPSIGEVVVKLPRAGAIATYGSSGFEFLTPNAIFMEVLGETMFDRRVADSPVFGPGLRNQWILGDVVARGELETLALRSSVDIFKGDEMISQYNLLGDPLLRMDAAAPRMDATRAGNPVIEGQAIDADPGLATTTLDLALVDETGLDRVEISDSEGRDYSGLVPGLTGPDPRQDAITVNLPVFPQAYTLEIATFDAARPELRGTVLGLKVEMPLDLFVDGEAVSPGSVLTLEPGLPRSIRVEFTSPVDLVAADIVIDYTGADVLNESKIGAGRDWSVEFDALAQADTEPGALLLVVQGQSTELLSGGLGPGALPPAVLRHAVFPNPVPGFAHIVVHVQGTVERARVSVYDLAGNQVNSSDAAISLSAPDPDSGTRIAMEFDARDHRGDELANGTYFYRISVEGPAGSAQSDMGRLVIMR